MTGHPWKGLLRRAGSIRRLHALPNWRSNSTARGEEGFGGLGSQECVRDPVFLDSSGGRPPPYFSGHLVVLSVAEGNLVNHDPARSTGAARPHPRSPHASHQAINATLADSPASNAATPRGHASGLGAVASERFRPRAGSKVSADFSRSSVWSAAKLKLQRVPSRGHADRDPVATRWPPHIQQKLTRCVRPFTTPAGPRLHAPPQRDPLCQNLDCVAAAERLRSRPSRQARRTSEMADRGLGCLRRPRAGVLFPVGTGCPTRPFPVDQAHRPGGGLQRSDRLGPRSLRSDLSARCRLPRLPSTVVRLGTSWRHQFRGLVHRDRRQPSSANSSCRVHGDQQHQPAHSWVPGVLEQRGVRPSPGQR